MLRTSNIIGFLETESIRTSEKPYSPVREGEEKKRPQKNHSHRLHPVFPSSTPTIDTIPNLLHRHRLREVTGEVHVQAFFNSKPVGNQLQGDDV